MKEWRRKHPRVKCSFPPSSNIPILMLFADPKKYSDGWGTVSDISIGGIGLITRTPVRLGQVVYLSFSISGNFTFVNAKAVIKRISENNIYFTCGLEFEAIVDINHLQEAIIFLEENG